MPGAHGLNGGQQIFVLCIADMRLKCQGCLGGFFRSARGAEAKEKLLYERLHQVKIINQLQLEQRSPMMTAIRTATSCRVHAMPERPMQSLR